MHQTATDFRAKNLHLFRRSDGRLVMRSPGKNAGNEIPVQVVCCFPWSIPGEFISVRDDKGHEVAFIESLDQPADGTRALIREELVDRLFIPRITAIEAIEDDLELLHWKVVTDAGPRTFLTARGEAPRKLRNGMILIKDVGNDLYAIRAIADLDARSNRLLWAYLD